MSSDEISKIRPAGGSARVIKLCRLLPEPYPVIIEPNTTFPGLPPRQREARGKWPATPLWARFLGPRARQTGTHLRVAHTHTPALEDTIHDGAQKKAPPADEDDGGDSVVWEVNSRKGTSRFTSRPIPLPASRQRKNPQGFACPQAKRAACVVPRCAPLCLAHTLCQGVTPAGTNAAEATSRESRIPQLILSRQTAPRGSTPGRLVNKRSATRNARPMLRCAYTHGATP